MDKHLNTTAVIADRTINVTFCYVLSVQNRTIMEDISY